MANILLSQNLTNKNAIILFKLIHEMNMPKKGNVMLECPKCGHSTFMTCLYWDLT